MLFRSDINENSTSNDVWAAVELRGCCCSAECSVAATVASAVTAAWSKKSMYVVRLQWAQTPCPRVAPCYLPP